MPIHPETLSSHAANKPEAEMITPSEAFAKLLGLIKKDSIFLYSEEAQELVNAMLQVSVDEIFQFAEQLANEMKFLAPPILFVRLFSLARLNVDTEFFVRCVLFEYIKNRKTFPLFVKSEDAILSDYFERNALVDSTRVMYTMEKECPEICYHMIKALSVVDFRPYQNLQEVLIALFLKHRKRNLSGTEAREDIKNEAILILRDQGLDEATAREVYDVWLYCHYEKLYAILSNVRQVKSLEIKNRQAVSTLVNEFGVYNFARYSADFLLRQTKEKDVKGEYVLLVYAKDDYNAALTQHTKELDLFLDKMKGYPVRVVEADGVSQLMVRLSKLRRKYGNRTIAGGMVSAHGSKDTMTFGSNLTKKKPTRRILTSEHASNQVVQLLKQYMVDNPYFIFVSCNTGQENGIAQKLSKSLDATVVAPIKPTNLKHIFAEHFDGVLYLNANYVDANVATSYSSGISGEIFDQSHI